MRRYLLIALTAVLALPIAACNLKKRTSKDLNPVVIETLISASESWNGDSYKYPIGKAQLTLQKITAQPNFKTNIHSHPQPGIAYVIQGSISCRTSDGQSLKAVAGESFATPQDTSHYCKIDGDETAVILVTSAGTKGQNTTVPYKK